MKRVSTAVAFLLISGPVFAKTVDEVRVSGGADLESLEQVDTVRGDFHVSAAGEVVDLVLPDLVRVEGTLSIGPGVETVRLPKLEHLGGLAFAGASALGIVEMPRLTEVKYSSSSSGNIEVDTTDIDRIVMNGATRLKRLRLPMLRSMPLPSDPERPSLVLTGNQVLERVELPRLGAVGLLASDNHALTHLELPAASRVASIVVTSNPSLLKMELGAFHEAGTIQVKDSPWLLNLPLASMTEVEVLELRNVKLGPELSLTRLQAADEIILEKVDGLQTLEFGAQTVRSLKVCELATLNEIRATLVESAISIEICSNPKLSSVKLSRLESIRGDARFWNNPELSKLVVGRLATVGGELKFTGTQLDTLMIGSLREVGQGLTIGENASLTKVDLPSLAEVGGGLSVINNGLLTWMGLAGLDSIGGTVRIAHNSSLKSLQLDKVIAMSGSLEVEDNPAMIEVVLPSLASVHGGLRLRELPAVTRLDVPQLTLVEGDLGVSGLDITELKLTALEEVRGTWTVSGSAGLQLISSRVRNIHGGLEVQANPTLASLELPALLRIGGTLTLQGKPLVAKLNSLREVGGGLSMSLEQPQFLTEGTLKDVSGNVQVPRGQDLHVCIVLPRAEELGRSGWKGQAVLPRSETMDCPGWPKTRGIKEVQRELKQAGVRYRLASK